MARVWVLALCVSTVIADTTTTIPDYFQTSFGPYAGGYETGRVPFLAQTNPALSAQPTYVPNGPLVTDIPVPDKPEGASIFSHMGNLSPYRPNADGFGVDEYALPYGSNITQIHMVHRHGSRYPTSKPGVVDRINGFIENGTVFTGNLSFLNSWTYQLGENELTVRGRQELFDSGILHYYNYGQLYNPGSNLIARTTTMVRMLQSAESFLYGFFGSKWTQNVTLEAIIDSTGFNNSMGGDQMCTNAGNGRGQTSGSATDQWKSIYLQDATLRFQNQSSGRSANWTVDDLNDVQSLCAYETSAFGYSPFCLLFTWDEWLGFEYTLDIQFYGNNGFASPVGRAIGLGFVEELIARLIQHLPDPPDDSIAFNTTLDDNNSTFPLNQTIYFDFSHDTEIFSMMTALGLSKFGKYLSPTELATNRSLVVSNITPFGGYFLFEVIKAPYPVLDQRPRNSSDSPYDTSGNSTSYVHMIMNQRTIPLGESIPDCGARDDGWCELQTFINFQQQNVDKANYNASCFGDYSTPGYGNITDGAIPNS
ncbi:histidine phosphatase superfamily [Talaromyces proteolyticus]|uniref:3-phytase n=1 Tax=Talaromyces proteolyticus TaxID=1131652 RepID=A0AAD4KQV4_9EURO|nr:histidine phosphatase superfamily [Talaromyces proteolyticus]KAH8697078.1 histidine phosphatase superfamily [Talaromyces proteolyticus]